MDAGRVSAATGVPAEACADLGPSSNFMIGDARSRYPRRAASNGHVLATRRKTMSDEERGDGAGIAEQRAVDDLEPPPRREVLTRVATVAAAGLATALLSGIADADAQAAPKITKHANGGFSFELTSPELGNALKQHGMLPAGVAPGKVSVRVSFKAKS
jgi:hypothetical protein